MENLKDYLQRVLTPWVQLKSGGYVKFNTQNWIDDAGYDHWALVVDQKITHVIKKSYVLEPWDRGGTLVVNDIDTIKKLTVVETKYYLENSDG